MACRRKRRRKIDTDTINYKTRPSLPAPHRCTMKVTNDAPYYSSFETERQFGSILEKQTIKVVRLPPTTCSNTYNDPFPSGCSGWIEVCHLVNKSRDHLLHNGNVLQCKQGRRCWRKTTPFPLLSSSGDYKFVGCDLVDHRFVQSVLEKIL